MNKTGSYEIELLNISPKKWDAFLMEHSNLPGPRVNMELARAFAHVGTLMDFKKYIGMDPRQAPENTPGEFLVFCGVLGLGEYLSKYHDNGLLLRLKERATDSRRLIREAVVMALQTIGRKNINRLKNYVRDWANGTFMEQRAAIATICEPEFLTDRETSLLALELLDWVTATMVVNDERQDKGYQILEKTLKTSWSFAVAALPEKGKPMMERWIKEKNPVVKRIMRKNLGTKRLSQMDSEWVESWIQKVKTP